MSFSSRRRFLQHTATTLAAAALAPLLSAAGKTEKTIPEKFEVLPYLQNPAPDAITVCFLSENATDVKILWSKGTAAPGTELKANGTAIPKVTWHVWKARLTGLEPGAAYRYKVVYKIDGNARESAIYSFKTLDPKAAKTRTVVFNDVHEKIPTLQALARQLKPADYEYSILLGDIWDQVPAANNAHRVFFLMANLVQLLDASQKPMLFLRGNHDFRNTFAPHLSYLFDFPGNDPSAKLVDQTGYYDWRAGPVWFIGNDTGEDGNKRPEIFQPYRERQVGWLKSLFAESPHRNAPWRFSLAHVPLYITQGGDSKDSRDRWAPVLNKANIDVALYAHQHRVDKMEKGKTYHVSTRRGQPTANPYDLTLPYHALIGGGPAMSGVHAGTITYIEADAKNLLIRIVNTEGKEATRLALKK